MKIDNFNEKKLKKSMDLYRNPLPISTWSDPESLGFIVSISIISRNHCFYFDQNSKYSD